MEVEVKENRTFLGILGALVGGLIGGAAIVLIGQLGFISAISGCVLAFCTLKGYELLNKGMDKTGIIVSIVVMLVVPYLADRVSWALVIVEELGADFDVAFAVVHELVEELELQADYWKDLLMVYGFTVLGAFGTVKKALKPAAPAKAEEVYVEE